MKPLTGLHYSVLKAVQVSINFMNLTNDMTGGRDGTRELIEEERASTIWPHVHEQTRANDKDKSDIAKIAEELETLGMIKQPDQFHVVMTELGLKAIKNTETNLTTGLIKEILITIHHKSPSEMVEIIPINEAVELSWNAADALHSIMEKQKLIQRKRIEKPASYALPSRPSTSSVLPEFAPSTTVAGVCLLPAGKKLVDSFDKKSFRARLWEQVEKSIFDGAARLVNLIMVAIGGVLML
jgi:hypothetical protein